MFSPRDGRDVLHASTSMYDHSRAKATLELPMQADPYKLPKPGGHPISTTLDTEFVRSCFEQTFQSCSESCSAFSAHRDGTPHS